MTFPFFDMFALIAAYSAIICAISGLVFIVSVILAALFA